MNTSPLYFFPCYPLLRSKSRCYIYRSISFCSSRPGFAVKLKSADIFTSRSTDLREGEGPPFSQYQIFHVSILR